MVLMPYHEHCLDQGVVLDKYILRIVANPLISNLKDLLGSLANSLLEIYFPELTPCYHIIPISYVYF